MATLYSTSYSNFSDADLYSMFRSENWASIPNNQKNELCQELANRSARDNQIEAAKVSVEDMKGSTIGYFSKSDGMIHINSNVVHNGVFKDEYIDSNGKLHTVEYPLQNANLRVMGNVFHEDWHHAQNESKDNPNVYGNNVQAQKNVEANLSGKNYIAEKDRDLYRIQQAEREANEKALQKTTEAMKATESKYSYEELGLASYQQKLTNDYNTALNKAREHYNDEDIQNTLSRAMNDNHYGNGFIAKGQKESYYQVRNVINDQYISRLQNAMNQSNDPAEQARYQAAIQQALQTRAQIDQAHNEAMLTQNSRQANQLNPTNNSNSLGQNAMGISSLKSEIPEQGSVHSGSISLMGNHENNTTISVGLGKQDGAITSNHGVSSDAISGGTSTATGAVSGASSVSSGSTVSSDDHGSSGTSSDDHGSSGASSGGTSSGAGIGMD